MNSLIEEAKLIVDRYQDIAYEYEENTIHIEPFNTDGFSISLIDEGYESILSFGRWHYPFQDSEEALDSYDNCISGNATLREMSSLGIPYKGILEVYDSGGRFTSRSYKTGTILGLFFFHSLNRS